MSSRRLRGEVQGSFELTFPVSSARFRQLPLLFPFYLRLLPSCSAVIFHRCSPTNFLRRIIAPRWQLGFTSELAGEFEDPSAAEAAPPAPVEFVPAAEAREYIAGLLDGAAESQLDPSTRFDVGLPRP